MENASIMASLRQKATKMAAMVAVTALVIVTLGILCFPVIGGLGSLMCIPLLAPAMPFVPIFHQIGFQRPLAAVVGIVIFVVGTFLSWRVLTYYIALRVLRARYRRLAEAGDGREPKTPCFLITLLAMFVFLLLGSLIVLLYALIIHSS